MFSLNTWKKEIEQDIISEQKSAQLPLELSNKILSLFLPGAVPFVLSKKYEENVNDEQKKQEAL
jgi:hypothetical protein